MSILIKNGRLITMNPKRDIFIGDLFVEKDQIKQIGKSLSIKAKRTIDAKGFTVLPGLIQTHVHLCQTLFRNQAEGLELLDWLKQKIWPFEGGHTPQSLRLSSDLGCAELLKSGTTTILDMGTVHHTDEIFKSCKEAGIRAFIGKAHMDEGAPPSLYETTKDSLTEAERLIESWHGEENGRLHYALAPRFVLSCSERLLKEIVKMSQKKGLLIHTHAAENRLECEQVEKERGETNIRYLHKLGLCSERTCLAHSIWVDEEEIEILSRTKTNVLHCPSSNLKLGSGIAKVPRLLKSGVNVTLGADGAPCNNQLDMFLEMRLSGLIQRPTGGVKALSSLQILEMATLNGAKALGLQSKIGSLETGKKADLILVNHQTLHAQPLGNMYDTLVYATRGSDVDTVIIDGKIVVDHGKLLTLSESQILKNLPGTF